MSSSRILPWIGVMAALSVIAGALGAVVWTTVVALPAYLIGPDSRATISESGLTSLVSADAAFVVIGLAAGLILGALAWSWFKTLGWLAPVLATASGLLAGLVCWGLGELLGPGPFDARVASAAPGDVVPVALQLRSYSALAAWTLAAVTPSLFVSSLGPEVRERDAPDRQPGRAV